jgi:hypothetical protein
VVRLCPAPNQAGGHGRFFDRAEMAAHVIEHCGYFILRQFLDEPEQLLTLRGHEPSVRRPSQARAWLCAARSVSARAR